MTETLDAVASKKKDKPELTAEQKGMALSSLSVVANGKPPAPLPPGRGPRRRRTAGRDPHDACREPGGQHDGGSVNDPVCGLTVDPATAFARRGADPDTLYFCSQGCAAAYDAGQAQHPTAAGPAHAVSAT